MEGKTVVVSVNTIAERDMTIKHIYAQLTGYVNPEYTVHQDRVNRIKVLYNEEHETHTLQSTIYTYIVIVLPIIFNLDPLENITGKVNFSLGATINTLTEFLNKLTSLQGDQIIEENTDVETFRQLVECLS